MMLRHPWLVSLLLGTVATPAAVILAVPAPRPLDVLLAWPLVMMDSWFGPGSPRGAPHERDMVHVVAFVIGIVLTWFFYVLVARVALWRVAAGERKLFDGS